LLTIIAFPTGPTSSKSTILNPTSRHRSLLTFETGRSSLLIRNNLLHLHHERYGYQLYGTANQKQQDADEDDLSSCVMGTIAKEDDGRKGGEEAECGEETCALFVGARACEKL
jgi:hypothetical protein